MFKRAFAALPATLVGTIIVAAVFSIPMLMTALPLTVQISLASWASPFHASNN